MLCGRGGGSGLSPGSREKWNGVVSGEQGDKNTRERLRQWFGLLRGVNSPCLVRP